MSTVEFIDNDGNIDEVDIQKGNKVRTKVPVRHTVPKPKKLSSVKVAKIKNPPVHKLLKKAISEMIPMIQKEMEADLEKSKRFKYNGRYESMGPGYSEFENHAQGEKSYTETRPALKAPPFKKHSNIKKSNIDVANRQLKEGKLSQEAYDKRMNILEKPDIKINKAKGYVTPERGTPVERQAEEPSEGNSTKTDWKAFTGGRAVTRPGSPTPKSKIPPIGPRGGLSGGKTGEPWKRISRRGGYAHYVKSVDKTPDMSNAHMSGDRPASEAPTAAEDRAWRKAHPNTVKEAFRVNPAKERASLSVKKAINLLEGYTPMSDTEIMKSFNGYIPDVMKDIEFRPPQSWWDQAITKSSQFEEYPAKYAMEVWYGNIEKSEDDDIAKAVAEEIDSEFSPEKTEQGEADGTKLKTSDLVGTGKSREEKTY